MLAVNTDAPRAVAADVWGMLAGAVAFLLPLAFSPSSTAPAWLPKTALLVVIVPLGLLCLTLQLRTPAAQAGLAFVGVTVVAAALSSAPQLSFIGPYGAGTSVLLFGATVGLFGIGRMASRPAKYVGAGILAAAAVNAVLAVVQARLDLGAYGLAIVESRSAALMGNPVHLATLLAGALPIGWGYLRQAAGRSKVAAVIVLIAAGAQVSGSRFLLLGVIVSAVALVVLRRDAAAFVFGAMLLLGLVLGGVIGHRPEFAGASDRIAQVGVAEGSTKQRLYTWLEAVPTVLERPILGFGPGRYLQATVRHRSAALAKAGPDSYFADAHNLFVEVSVGAGLLGLASLVLWLTLAIRGAAGPLLWSGLVLLAMHLVEPAHPGTTPLIGLTLGAAAVGSAALQLPLRAPRRALVAAAAVAGFAGGAVLLVGDVRLQQARISSDREAAAAAAGRLPPWPEVSDAVGRVVAFDALVGRDAALWEQAARWERRAVNADTTDPRWWVQAGSLELKAGDRQRAERSFRTALTLNPYSCGAWRGVAAASGDSNGGDPRFGRFCQSR